LKDLPALSDPVGEQITRVAVLRALHSDSEACEEGGGCGGRGDIGRCAGFEDGCRECRCKRSGGKGESEVFHGGQEVSALSLDLKEAGESGWNLVVRLQC
jgi:hypothetical protein